MTRVHIAIVALGLLTGSCAGTPPGADAGTNPATDAGADAFTGNWAVSGTVTVPNGGSAQVTFLASIVKATDGNYRVEIADGCSLVYVRDAVATTPTLHALAPQTSCTVTTAASTTLVVGGNAATVGAVFDLVIVTSDATVAGATLAMTGSGTGKNGASGAVTDMTFAYTFTRR